MMMAEELASLLGLSWNRWPSWWLGNQPANQIRNTPSYWSIFLARRELWLALAFQRQRAGLSADEWKWTRIIMNTTPPNGILLARV